MEPGTDFCLVDRRLLGKSSSLFGEWDGYKKCLYCISFKRTKNKFFKMSSANSNILFLWSHWERERHGGGRGASHGDTWQSHSAETRGDDAALTPTPQTAPETSPGWHKVKLEARISEKTAVYAQNTNHGGVQTFASTFERWHWLMLRSTKLCSWVCLELPWGGRCYPPCPGRCTWPSSWLTWQRGQHRCSREASPFSAGKQNIF